MEQHIYPSYLCDRTMNITTNLNKLVALMIVASFLAGCTDALPSPPEDEFEGQVSNAEWLNMTGEFTLVMDNNSNASFVHAPTIWVDVNTSYGAVSYTHLTLPTNSLV